jgi:hypothetical protein
MESDIANKNPSILIPALDGHRFQRPRLVFGRTLHLRVANRTKLHHKLFPSVATQQQWRQMIDDDGRS